MQDSRPYSITNLFSNPACMERISLVKIKRRTVMLLKLNDVVDALLPAPLRLWCRVANFRQGVMVLETANATWKMRLRYEQIQLLSVLREQILPSLLSIDIKINPSLARKDDPNLKHNINNQQSCSTIQGKPNLLSTQSAKYILHMATTRSEGTLKNALERLAGLAKDIPLGYDHYKK